MHYSRLQRHSLVKSWLYDCCFLFEHRCCYSGLVFICSIFGTFVSYFPGIYSLISLVFFPFLVSLLMRLYYRADLYYRYLWFPGMTGTSNSSNGIIPHFLPGGIGMPLNDLRIAYDCLLWMYVWFFSLSLFIMPEIGKGEFMPYVFIGLVL